MILSGIKIKELHLISDFKDNNWEVPIKTKYGDIPWSVLGLCCIGKSTFIQSNRCKDIIGYKGNDKFDIGMEYGLVVDSSAINIVQGVVWSGPNKSKSYVTLNNPRMAEIIEWGYSNINLNEDSIFLYKHIWKNRTRDVIAQESWVVIQGKV